MKKVSFLAYVTLKGSGSHDCNIEVTWEYGLKQKGDAFIYILMQSESVDTFSVFSRVPQQ